MVAGNHQGLDAVGCHAVQVIDHALVAGEFAVVGQVTRDQDDRRLDGDNAVGDGSHDVVTLGHHLDLTGIGQVNGVASLNQGWTEQMGVADDHDAVQRSAPGGLEGE